MERIYYAIERKLGRADKRGKKHDSIIIRLPKAITGLWGWMPGDVMKLSFDNVKETMTISKNVQEKGIN